MLKAICKTTGNHINADEITEYQIFSEKHEFVCPITRLDVSFIKSHERLKKEKTFVRAHFRHRAKLAEIPDHFLWDGDLFKEKEGRYYVNESIEHQIGKQAIKKMCENTYPQLNPNTKPYIEYEYVIKLPSGKWRIADVAVIYPMGVIDVHEVQLCKITPDQLEERSYDYRTQGINSYWHFGGSANTNENIEWYFESNGRMPNILTFDKMQYQPEQQLSEL